VDLGWWLLAFDPSQRTYQGKFPAMPIVAIPADHPVPPVVGWGDWILSWVPDFALMGMTAWFAAGHFLGWFLLSPWPVKIGAALGAFIGPFVLVVRARESWHRGTLNRALRDEALRRKPHDPMAD
jgi:hypothetical protein